MRPTPRLLLAALVSLAVATPLWAQWRPLYGPPPSAPCPPCQPWAPGMPGAPGAPGAPGMPGDTTGMGQPQGPGAQAPDVGDAGGRGAVLASGSSALPGLVGGFGQQKGEPGVTRTLLTSGMRLLAGDSIVPFDRVYIAFTYTNGVIQDFSQAGAFLTRFNQFVELMGVEKTFLNNRASLTVRVPVSTLHTDSLNQIRFFNQGTGTSTIVGDGSLILKFILFDNPERGNMFAAGIAAASPTGQTHFLGNEIPGFLIIEQETRDWVIQPYVGAIFRRGEFTFQTVTGAGLPTSADHANYVYTTGSAAWMFYHAARRNQFVTSMSAIAEVSVLEPLGPLRGSIAESQRTADFISITIGNSIVLRNWVYWTYGVSSPLTREKPYSTQVVSSLSVRY